MTTCAFPNVNAAILDPLGTNLIDLHDHENGYEILAEIPRARWNDGAPRVTSVYMNGSAAVAPPTTTDAIIPVRFKISGTDRAQVRAREDAVWSAWKAHPTFLLDVVEDIGVAWRYRAERVAYDPSPVTHESLLLVKQEVALSFLVQPDPINPAEES